MGAEEKNMNEILSRIVADLFTSAGSEDLSAKIQTLRQEIKKVIEREDTLFGKFLEVAESFREIIPEENKRYSAAVKALVTTSKISRQEIVKAVNTQLEELKVLEKILLATTSGGRDKIKGVEARAREIKDEITKLRGEIGRLESEGKEVLAHLAAQEKAVEPAEKAVRQLFADITAEIGLIKKRVEEPTTAERAVLQPVPPGDPGAGGIPGDGGQTSDFSVPAAPPQDTGSQKRCPMCGGRMDLQMDGKTMLCYSCAYQELKAEKEKGGEQKSDFSVPAAPQQLDQDTGSQKKCPMCGGRMDLQMNGEMWLCYSCAYEESGTGGVQSSPSSVPLASLSSDQHEELPKEPVPGPSPSDTKPPTKSKTCRACGGNMKWTGKAWHCPFCGNESRI